MPASDASEQDAPPRLRLKMGVGAALTLGLVVLSAAVGFGILRGQSAPIESFPLETDRAGTVSATDAQLYVHVLGEVARPGLYILAADARLVDALAAAGGSLETADLRAVNLARQLSDGEQVVVPAQGQDPAGGGGAAPPAVPATDSLIDINTADKTALETLPRIGPALAQRIIEWRDANGRFRSVDDLLAVPGIGEKLLAGLRDKVRV